MDRIEEIEKEIERLQDIIYEKDKNWNHEVVNHLPDSGWSLYYEHIKPETSKIAKLDRELRMIMPYELSDLPDYGDVMSLKEFIECCNSGGFIDYDGHGYYIKDGKETNIMIHPSDVKYKSIRKEFDTIIWYNR